MILSLVLTGCAAIFGAEPSAGPDPSPSAAADQGTLLADPVLYELDGGFTAALPADLADSDLRDPAGTRPRLPGHLRDPQL